MVLSKLLALVIEDNVDQAEILAKSLQIAGFEAETINDGNAAMSRLDAVAPDLVVLDLHLPGVSGTAILLKIRGDPRLAHLPVIVVTVEPQTAGLVQDEADLILIKPIDFVQFGMAAVSLCQTRR
jgi:DNA-binding response OmpR family regulator